MTSQLSSYLRVTTLHSLSVSVHFPASHPLGEPTQESIVPANLLTRFTVWVKECKECDTGYLNFDLGTIRPHLQDAQKWNT